MKFEFWQEQEKVSKLKNLNEPLKLENSKLDKNFEMVELECNSLKWNYEQKENELRNFESEFWMLSMSNMDIESKLKDFES